MTVVDPKTAAFRGEGPKAPVWTVGGGGRAKLRVWMNGVARCIFGDQGRLWRRPRLRCHRTTLRDGVVVVVVVVAGGRRAATRTTTTPDNGNDGVWELEETAQTCGET